MKLEVIDGKATNWGGLWWQPESNYFTSQTISLAQLRKFKGNVRLVVRKNKFFNNGENGRPNYVFLFRDAKSENPFMLEVGDDPDKKPSHDEYGCYYDEDGNRLYTHAEVQTAINGAVEDGRNGYGPGDVIVSDYL